MRARPICTLLPYTTLFRSNARLAVAAVDPKFKTSATSRWPVYVSRKEKVAEIEAGLRKQMPAADFARIEIRQLPEDLRSEEHTSELQSLRHIVCRLLLEKK